MAIVSGPTPDARFEEILDRLTAMSERDYYNPYQLFQWPDSLPADEFWMTPELISVNNTDFRDEVEESQLRALSRWESINFYSLNVHGIRELLIEVVSRIHTNGFERQSEYFHHLIGEENEHMWFFANFCLRYATIYPDKKLHLPATTDPRADNFLVFSRLLIFEEIVDFFNKRLGDDERLHPTIRQVNAIHHQDEARHITFGRQAVAALHRSLREQLSRPELAEVERYVKTYMRVSLDSLCNPAAYRDAGFPKPYEVRRRVLADPGYLELQRSVLKSNIAYMVREGILTDGVISST